VVQQRHEPPLEGVEGVVGLQQVVAEGVEALVVALDQGLDQVVAGGEVAVERADAHAGAAGDVVERRLGAPLGEGLVSGFEQAGPVAQGVGPEGAVLGCRHGAHGMPFLTGP
jgi:hypothetical protein